MMSGKRPRNTHIFERAAHDLYIEPPWVSKRLFAVETFPGVIVDPCCGTGMIPEAARAAGLSSYASDIADHGYGQCLRDFLTEPAPTTLHFSVVTNPPYGLAREIVERALELGALKVAIFFPIARMNAAWRWLTPLPLAHMYLVSPRPSVPPRTVFDHGEKAKGGRPDFIWLILDRKYEGKPTWGWLHRDGIKAMLEAAINVSVGGCSESRRRRRPLKGTHKKGPLTDCPSRPRQCDRLKTLRRRAPALARTPHRQQVSVHKERRPRWPIQKRI